MIKAINEPRSATIAKYCLPIWNQPFFFHLDQAKALTISYSPTDKGARTNYANIYERYKENNKSMSAENIFDLLYNFKKENYWRKKYDKIFTSLGIDCAEIAHMDISSFPYKKDIYRQKFSALDTTYCYPLQVIHLLSEQLKYILIDGKDNKKIIEKYFIQDYEFINSTKLVVNHSNKKSDLIIYQHKSKNTKLIYFGTFLYGATCVSYNCVNEIINFINDSN